MNTEIITSALTLSRSNYENSDVKEVSEAFVANIFFEDLK